MNRPIVAALVGLAVAMFIGIAPASAQATRTWVSGVGDDANPCSRTAPCKTWAGAISKTADCGEIDALDPGGFGALTITKGITIDGGGGQVASVLVAGTNGFIINNTDQTCGRVIIRNLDFQGLSPAAGAGINGINILAGNVVLEHLKIQNFTTDCVNFQEAVAGAQLTIINSDFVGCANAGLEVSNATGHGLPAVASITGSTFEQNGTGIIAQPSGWVSIHNSTISSNTVGGIESNGANSAVVIDSSMVDNLIGFNFYSTNNGAISISSNNIALSSGFALKFDTGGRILTFSNNWLQFNTQNDGHTGTTAPQ